MLCIKCEKWVPSIFDDTELYQPNGGVTLIGYGAYGSAAYDPMDSTYLQTVICDECLIKAENVVTVKKDEKVTTTTHLGSYKEYIQNLNGTFI